MFLQANWKGRRERDIIDSNETKQVPDQLEVKKGKDGLKIQEKVYRKQVQPPDPTKLLQMQEEELDEILQMKLTELKRCGKRTTIRLLPIASLQRNLQTVRKAYMSVKLANPSARHVVCIWNLAAGGMDHELCDYQDDGDHGCGRPILQMMQRNNIIQRAIYVARYTGEYKLGNSRYDAYTEAAKLVVRQAPYNHLTKCDQIITEQLEGQDRDTRPKRKFYRNKPQNRPQLADGKPELTMYNLPTAEELENARATNSTMDFQFTEPNNAMQW